MTDTIECYKCKEKERRFVSTQVLIPVAVCGKLRKKNFCLDDEMWEYARWYFNKFGKITIIRVKLPNKREKEK